MTERRKSRRRPDRQTKDRVLQARIPEQLDDELRGRAEQLGLSVSTIVRNTLLHTFDLVEGVVADSAQIARTFQLQDKAPTPLSADAGDSNGLSSVLGWQELVLNRNAVCEACNTILPRGERAALGLPAAPRPLVLCQSCLAKVSPTGEEPDHPGQADKKPAGKRSSKASARSSARARSKGAK